MHLFVQNILKGFCSSCLIKEIISSGVLFIEMIGLCRYNHERNIYSPAVNNAKEYIKYFLLGYLLSSRFIVVVVNIIMISEFINQNLVVTLRRAKKFIFERFIGVRLLAASAKFIRRKATAIIVVLVFRCFKP